MRRPWPCPGAFSAPGGCGHPRADCRQYGAGAARAGLPGIASRADCERRRLLIFDEVMTGFRVAYGGAQELSGITPDVTALGKIVGGGLPAAAYGASAAIMDQVSPVGPIFQAGTLSGNPLAMAAGPGHSAARCAEAPLRATRDPLGPPGRRARPRGHRRWDSSRHPASRQHADPLLS